MALNSLENIKSTAYPTFLQNMKKYFHKISFSAIITNDDGTTTVIDLSDVLFDFKTFKLYNAFVFPVVAVSVNLTPKQHKTFANNLDRLQFRLNLEKFQETDISTNNNRMFDKTTDSVYKNLILELSDYEKQRFIDETERNNNGFEESIKIPVYMELFKAEHLAINKNPINGIFNDVDMDSLLIHLLKKSKQKMLVQKSNRKEKLKQVVLPGKNLAQTIEYLQEVYGIYRSGLRLFFDFDRGYCLSHDITENEPVSEKEPIEYKNVVCYIDRQSERSTSSSGCWMDDTTKTYYLLAPNSNQLETMDKSSKNIYGNKLVIQSSTQDKKQVDQKILDNNYKIENSTNTKTVLESRTVTRNQDYTVAKNDTLSSIARKFNISVSEIIANNKNIVNEDSIYVKQTIKIPITTVEIIEVDKILSEVESTVKPDEKEEKVKYYYNTSSNSYAEDELLSRINRNELKYIGNFKDVDETFLSMNKAIYLSFLDESYTNYNGMYEIEGMGTIYTKIGKNIYETDTIVTFTRLTKGFLAFS